MIVAFGGAGWRRSAMGLVLLAALAMPALAADKPRPAAELPSPLTPEAVRELVSRMPDEEVRKLLIRELDRGATAKAAGAKAKDGGLVGHVDAQGRRFRAHLASVIDGVRGLPAAFATLATRLGEESRPAGYAALGGFLAAMLAAGAVAEWAWRRLSARWRAALRARAARGLLASLVRLALRTLVEVAHVAVFGGAALAVFLAFWHGGPATHAILLGVLGTLLLARLVWALGDFLLAPGRPDERLVPLDDASGRLLVARLALLMGLFGVVFALTEALTSTGAPASVTQAAGIVVSTAILALALSIVWRLRRPIAERIRAAGGDGPVARWAADLWPAAAVLYLLSVYVGRIVETLEGLPMRGEGLASLAILVAMPVVDHALTRALEMSVEGEDAAPVSARRKLVRDYEPVLRRLIHIGVVIAGFALLAQVWDLDLFAFAERSLGGRIASSLIGIFIVVLLAYVAWDAARTAIDRRLAEEGTGDDSAPVSRLRTLLPLLRVTLAVTIFAMAVMSVLAAMGVDILPLLAGASVVGVAVGFGSQTLVRDVVSGAFFLMDDAFRLGEYIEVGDAKGRIEKITLRSLFLRHHRGALNVLPYGEIKRLRNTSRDWMIMVLEFKLALDTDPRKVKKIVKQIADEVAADPELGPHLLSPLKSQGVLTTDDSSITVRVKYMAKPGDGPFMIRRVAYEKILKAFAAQGVEFAGKRVAVYIPGEAAGDRRAVAGAAALQALDAPPAGGAA